MLIHRATLRVRKRAIRDIPSTPTRTSKRVAPFGAGTITIFMMRANSLITIPAEAVTLHTAFV